MRRYWRSHAPTESLLASSQGAASTSRSQIDRKSTRLNSSHSQISYAVFCLKKKKKVSILVAGRFHPDSIYTEPLRLQGLMYTADSQQPRVTSERTGGDLMHEPVTRVRETTA